MFSLIIKTIRTAAFIGVLGVLAFIGYEYYKTRDSDTVAQTVKTTAETSADWAAVQTEEARKAWQQLDLERKVDDFQDKTRPVGRKISTVVGQTVGPSFKPVKEGERRMSMPALILALVFGSVFVLLGKFSNTGRY